MTEQSPVVPSVGAVPVEVPEEWCRAAEHAYEFTPYTEMAQHAWPNAVRALYPLIAARVRAEERQRIAAEIRIYISRRQGEFGRGWDAAAKFLSSYIECTAPGSPSFDCRSVGCDMDHEVPRAAGSAVPDVPPGVSTCPACWTDGPNDELCPAHRAEYDASLRASALPVATPGPGDMLAVLDECNCEHGRIPEVCADCDEEDDPQPIDQMQGERFRCPGPMSRG